MEVIRGRDILGGTTWEVRVKSFEEIKRVNDVFECPPLTEEDEKKFERVVKEANFKFGALGIGNFWFFEMTERGIILTANYDSVYGRKLPFIEGARQLLSTYYSWLDEEDGD